MLVDLIRTPEGRVIGWEMKGENPEEIKKLGIIRDLQFWGAENCFITYGGRKDSDDANMNPGTLMWKLDKYVKDGQ